MAGWMEILVLSRIWTWAAGGARFLPDSGIRARMKELFFVHIPHDYHRHPSYQLSSKVSRADGETGGNQRIVSLAEKNL